MIRVESPVNILSLSETLDYSMFLETIELLKRNLPFESMRRVAAQIPYNRNNILRMIACVDGSRTVGGLFGGPLNDDCSYLEFLWLKPEYRQMKLGKRILTAFEDAQRKLGVKTIEAETYEQKNTQWMNYMGYPAILNGLDGKLKFCHHRKTL